MSAKPTGRQVAAAQAAQQKKTAFLKALQEGASVVSAVDKAKVPRRTVYDWRNADPDFAAAWDRAYTDGTDALEAEAQRRAVEGTEKPVTVAGKREIVREYSDTLLIFLLKARRPERFRDHHKVEVSGPQDAPIQVEHTGRLTLADVARFAGNGPD